ncbi:hypothetical protein DPMN_075360 [Dreissena polymorpha]|uniref:Uncharacterized protein n=1 Tax=Dreissena polymorpha TaxID=45954 RepID=A0A9D4BLG4_DREPO|nr:hypothetical protein DPMN_075360 [Dreissena polymorpha]
METKRRPTYVPTFSDASNLPLKINTGVPNLLVPYTEEVEYLPHDQVFTYDNTFYYNQPTESAYTHYDT